MSQSMTPLQIVDAGICGHPSPGGGLNCQRDPHAGDVGHVWVHESADDSEPPSEPT